MGKTREIAEAVVPIKEEIGRPIISIKSEPLSISKATGNPLSEYAKTYLRQHVVTVSNPNDFAITSLQVDFNFPEPVYNVVWIRPPAGQVPNFRQASSEGTRLHTNGTIVGNSLRPDRVWKLSLDKIPAHDQIEILLLTTNDMRDAAIVFYMRRIAQDPSLSPMPGPPSSNGVRVSVSPPNHVRDVIMSPEPKTGRVVDFIRGTFQKQKNDESITSTFFTELFFDPETRSISAGATEESQGQLVVDGDALMLPHPE